jgi:two-component system phosphate regulon sensor histidine kinase PhoR
VFLQFCWWAYLLADQNREIYENKILHSVQDKETLTRTLHKKWFMIGGEGVVFLSLLGLGVFKTRQAFQKEVALNRQQKNFLLSITHEFKSPLASIRLYLQTLQRHDLEKEKKDSFIKNAIDDTERLDKLVENALLASQIENSSYFSKRRINLSLLIKEILDKIPSKGSIVASIEDDLFFNADSLAIASLLLNLVENANKYSSGAPVKVSLARVKNKIVLSVADEGIGVPDNEKMKIFDKFYRIGSEETRKSKGTGLGLFIAKHIAEAHHGKISVKNNLPKGSIFEVSFSIISDEQ